MGTESINSNVNPLLMSPSGERTSIKTSLSLCNEVAHPIYISIGQRIPTHKDSLAVGFSDELLTNAIADTSTLSFGQDSFIKAKLYFASYATDVLRPLELEIAPSDFSYFGGIIISPCPHLGPTGCALFELTINLRRPPKFWVTANNVRRRGTEKDGGLDGGYEGDGIYADKKIFKGLQATGDASDLRLGRWLTYRFEIRAQELGKLRAWVNASLLQPVLVDSSTYLRKLSPELTTEYLEPRKFPADLDFKIGYAVEGLLSFGKILDMQVPELLDLIRPLHQQSPYKAERILYALHQHERVTDIPAAIKALTSKVSALPFKILPNTSLVSKIVVTPTRTLCYPPELQTSNFVLRSFEQETNDFRFVRIQFFDESTQFNMNRESRINDEADAAEGILARFRRCLVYGLKVGGRIYLPLAYSASQARTHAFWAISFVSGTFTRLRIMNYLGDFDTERIVAKNAARRGQSFSTTTDAGQISTVSLIEDFKNENCSYTYSDGVGICTQKVIEDACVSLGLPAKSACAVQFRLGGSKGMLVAWPAPPRDRSGDLLFPELQWPELDPQASTICLRPSQIKFASAHKCLGALLVSQYAGAFLNREVINLLFDGGVKLSDFTRLQHQQIEQIMATEEEIIAGTWKPHQARLFSQVTTPLMELMKNGWSNEPAIRSLVRLLCTKALYLIKWKARIFVEKGAHLLGVIDELGVLEEGQIYLRTNDGKTDSTVTGKCIIYRAPTRHPGDIQVVEAVDHPALRASGLVNVVVFNRAGARDLPSMLSGGDLDGDLYSVIWDSKLTKYRKEEPMDYTPPNSEKLDKVSADLTRKFHNIFMRYNLLGSISNAHLAISDRWGSNSPDALDLAMLCSIAVDYAKTGVHAELPFHLKPAMFPDFMPRRHETPYESERVLGVLFRNPLLCPIPKLKSVEEVIMDPRIAKLASPPPGALKFAEHLKACYDLEMRGLMVRFTANEAEIFTGTILPDPTLPEKSDQDYKLRDPLLQAFKAARSHIFDEIVITVGEKNLEIKKRQIAHAAYIVTYNQAKKEVNPSRRMLTFPFLFHEQLQDLVA